MTKGKLKNSYRSLKDAAMSDWLWGDSLNNHIKTGYNIVRIDHAGAAAAGLSLEICGEDHYLVGHLFVSESGTDDKLQRGRTIGQVLLLNGCNSSTTDIYRRLGNCSNGQCNWGKWTQITDKERLDELKDSIFNSGGLSSADAGVFLGRLQGTSEFSDAAKDPFKLLGTFLNINGSDFKTALNSLHSTSSGEFEGFWRANVGSDIVEIQNIVINYKDDHWLQVLKSMYGYNASSGNFSIMDGVRYRIMYREYKNDSWGEWRSITQDNADAITEIKSKALRAKTLELKGDGQKLELTGSTIDETTSVALSIPAATDVMAGVMSAEDKEVLNTLSIGSYDTYNDIELLETPARLNNAETVSSGYSGYKYDLSAAYGKGYKYIYFRGSNFTADNNIIRGLVVAADGSVESFVKTSEPLTNGWQKLPITPNSAYLKATYTKGLPPESYGEVFTPEYINLIKTEGVIDSVNSLKENVDIIKQGAGFISFNMLNLDDLLNGLTLSSGKIVNNENGIFSNKLYLEVGKSYTLKNLPLYMMEGIALVKSVFVARYDAEDNFIERDAVMVSTVSDYNTVVYTPTSDAAYYRVLLQSGFNQEHPFDASRAMIYEGTEDVKDYIPYAPVYVSAYDKMQDEKFSKLNVKNDNVVEQIGNILITGASFAYDGNTWFSKVCKALGVKGYNKAVSGESIKNTAVKMYNGTLYSKAEFEDFDTLLIMHVHNEDVCDETDLEENKNYAVSISMSYSQAYDYVLKKYAAECYAAKDDNTSKWYGTQCGKPCKVVCMTHWHDARTIFNQSIRKLVNKWGIGLVELDKEIGFCKDVVHPVTGEQQSVIYAQDTQTIDGITYGWHPSREDGAYIQDRIADIVVRTLKGERQGSVYDAIEQGKSLALRTLFIAAGAEYNDTYRVIQKIAPWETEEKWRLEDDGTYTYWEEPAIVDHLPKHYYLHGLGDITEQEMINIYNAGYCNETNSNPLGYVSWRTNLGRRGSLNANLTNDYFAMAADKLQYAWLSIDRHLDGALFTIGNNAFAQSKKLRKIICGSLSLTAAKLKAFVGCSDFEEVANFVNNKTTVSFSFADSPKIYKRWILKLIKGGEPQSAITITLHPDAYARISNQPDIIEALNAQPLITLVSA